MQLPWPVSINSGRYQTPERVEQYRAEITAATDNGLIAVVRLFFKGNLEILEPCLASLIHGMTDTAAASMLSVSRSLITKIKNRKLRIIRNPGPAPFDPPQDAVL